MEEWRGGPCLAHGVYLTRLILEIFLQFKSRESG